MSCVRILCSSFVAASGVVSLVDASGVVANVYSLLVYRSARLGRPRFGGASISYLPHLLKGVSYVYV
jgi:hypothetical protein